MARDAIVALFSGKRRCFAWRSSGRIWPGKPAYALPIAGLQALKATESELALLKANHPVQLDGDSIEGLCGRILGIRC